MRRVTREEALTIAHRTLERAEQERVEAADRDAGLNRRVAALEAFALKVIECAWDGCDADGGDIQEWALEAGLLVRVTATEPCGENCRCVEWDDFPQECLRLSREEEGP